MAGRVHPRELGKDGHEKNGSDIFNPRGITATADPEVTQKENANLELYQEFCTSQPEFEDSNLPNRPNFAQHGTPVTLRANLFELRLNDDQQLFTYKADVDQRVHKSKRHLRDFFRTILKRLPELQPLGHGVVIDYVSLLVTCAKIDLGPTDKKTYGIPYYEQEDSGAKVEAEAKPFEFTLSLIQPISSADLSRYVGSSPAILDERESANSEIIRALNVVIAGHPSKHPGVYPGGQNIFFLYPDSPSAASKYDLEGGLIAVRGYFYSVRFATLKVLLNVHGQCNPFYKEINARELMQEFEDLEPQQTLHDFFRMLRVKTLYTKGPDGSSITKYKTVIGVSLNNADNTKFKLKRRQPEVTISVTEYFGMEYGVKLKHPEKRLLNCGTTSQPVWIPAELCTVMPGQRYFGDLHPNQTTRMLTIAARPPGENAKRLVAEDGGLGLIGVVPQRCETLTAFGVTIDPNMVVVPGRVLKCPRLKYGRNNTVFAPKGGAWNLSGKTFLKPARMSSWTLLRIGAAAEMDLSTLASQLKALTNVFTKHGLKAVTAEDYPGPAVDLPRAADGELGIDRSVVDESLKKVFEKYKQKGIGMFMVILPSEDPWLYARVKYWGEVGYGVHTSCVQMSKMRKANVNISANVALKVNLKLGGVNQGLDPVDLGFLRHGNTMVIGIDVTHPKPGSMRGTPSIAGVVASIDAEFTQWPGNIRCQKSRKEMVSDLDILVEERVSLWVSKNENSKLENVLVYRDGVSDSQYETVLQEEVPAVRKACAKVLGDSPQPKITYIIAVKRHHTRLYPTDKEGADTNHKNNIKNGTVVDRGITMPSKWDFFMASHVALQGTTKPAHYVVVLDEIRDIRKLAADHLEQITHNLCYLHGTTTSAVSLCPPAYYADIICERGSCYIADYVSSKKPTDEFDYNESPWLQGVHESLKDSMFYV